MELEEVRKYVGKKVKIILKNGYSYTATLPEIFGDSFTISDKYGNKVTIVCDYIALIIEGKHG